MKCFSIKQPERLRKYILANDVKDIIVPGLRKREHIGEAYLDFQLFPGFTYNMFAGAEDCGIYGYGTSTLVEKQTAHGKHLPKTALLLLYDHTRFYPDRREGDRSRGIWMNQRFELLITCPVFLALRETGTNAIHKLTSKGTLFRTARL